MFSKYKFIQRSDLAKVAITIGQNEFDEPNNDIGDRRHIEFEYKLVNLHALRLIWIILNFQK